MSTTQMPKVMSRPNCYINCRMPRNRLRELREKQSHFWKHPLACSIPSGTRDHLLPACASQVWVISLAFVQPVEWALRSLFRWRIIFQIPRTFETCAANTSSKGRHQQKMVSCTWRQTQRLKRDSSYTGASLRRGTLASGWLQETSLLQVPRPLGERQGHLQLCFLLWYTAQGDPVQMHIPGFGGRKTQWLLGMLAVPPGYCH